MNRLLAIARVRPAVLALVAVLLVSAVASCGRAAPKAAAYHCPMHPTYVSDKPGDCPICGMALEPIPPAGGGSAASSHSDAEQAADAGVPGMAPVEVGAEGLRLAGIQTAAVTRGPVSRTIRTVGTITPDETRVRHIHTKIAGWVEKLWVNFTGQLVRRGDPVLAIYSQELVASQEELLRARDLAARFAASELPEVRKGAEDLVAAARRRLLLFDVPERLVAELEQTGRPERSVTLSAPVSGYVTSKSAFEGQQVEPGMELFTITDLSRVWLEAEVYEYEAPLVALGQRARLSLPYQPGEAVAGRISYIYPTMNPETRTLRVRYELANPKQALRPGMFANVEIDLSASDALLIPDSAVLDTGERQVVFVALGDGRFEPREVRTRPAGGGLAEAMGGLHEGDRVVVRANFLLDSESRLRSALGGLAVGGAAHPPSAHDAPAPKKEGRRP